MRRVRRVRGMREAGVEGAFAVRWDGGRETGHGRRLRRWRWGGREV